MSSIITIQYKLCHGGLDVINARIVFQCCLRASHFVAPSNLKFCVLNVQVYGCLFF